MEMSIINGKGNQINCTGNEINGKGNEINGTGNEYVMWSINGEGNEYVTFVGLFCLCRCLGSLLFV